jgi:hypothetical protein
MTKYRRIKFFINYWKLGIHLLFRTKRFGVNNEWWSPFDSLFGGSLRERLNIINNYRMMKIRAGDCHFLNDEDYQLCFGKDKVKKV